MRVRLLVAVLVLACVAAAQDSLRPRHNASYVPDDDEGVRGLVTQATEAAKAGDTDGAVEGLQTLLLSENGGVVALRGRALFVSPRRWAAIRLLSEQAPFDRKVLDAWRKVHDGGANAALAGAIGSGDEAAVLKLLRRYPAATAAPAALLALADRALQRGDRDRARGYLLRAPEHVAQSDLASWLASPAYAKRKRHLDGLPPPERTDWPTLCGAAGRARNGDPLPGRMVRLWETPILDSEPLTFDQHANYGQREHSPILPFYPVLDEGHIYVHLGGKVVVIARSTGKLLYYAPAGTEVDEREVDAMLAGSPGLRAVTLDGGVLYFNRLLFARFARCLRRNALTAFDTRRRSVAWEVRPGSGDAGLAGVLARPVFFRGAPAVAHDRLYVYGAVREESEGKPSRKEEAYLFCFDAKTGALVWHRFLGYGDTEAAPRLPPQSGLPPAVAHGVVVAVSGLGVAAGLDAETGEILWLLRYDKKPVRERERLTEWTEEQVHVGAGWLREPPRIAGDTVLIAPIDSDGRYACWLRGRRHPADGGFYLQQWYRRRSDHSGRNSLLEQLAGLASGRIWYVGRRDENHSVEAYQTVVSHPIGDEVGGLAFGRIPVGERHPRTGELVPPEVFGRAAIAGNVLLVPTRKALFRWDVGRAPTARIEQGVEIHEIAPLWPPFVPKAEKLPKGAPLRPLFGSLVALGGRLYAVSATRVLCYGAQK